MAVEEQKKNSLEGKKLNTKIMKVGLLACTGGLSLSPRGVCAARFFDGIYDDLNDFMLK